jgi:phosphoribosylglycinamide formyltransferase-1
VIGVLVSGEGSNLQALIDAALPIAAVVSNKSGVRALERAQAAAIDTRVYRLEDYADRAERDAAMAEWLEERGVELVVLAGYMHLLTRPFLDRFPDRIVNVHPSLLPAFPGARAVEEQLSAQVIESGATVHLVDEGVDSGRILRQERVPIVAGDTAETLHERIKAVEHRLLPQVVRELLAFWRAASSAGPEGTVRRSTGPESTVPAAAQGGGGAGLRPAGATADQGARCVR